MVTKQPASHLHVRVVIAQCPQGHGMAALAGTSPEPSDDELMEGFVGIVDTRMPELVHGCRICGAARDTWTVEVYTSPPLASQAEADALVARITAEVMGETVLAYEVAGADLVPVVVH